MAIGFDAALGIHPMALGLRAQRAEVLASNLAHADTPSFKARDLDFAALLSQSRNDAGVLAVTHPTHLSTSSIEGGAGELLYRVPSQSAIDGNTVDAQVEQAHFGRNALQYQASLTFLGGKFRSLMTAIRGD